MKYLTIPYFIFAITYSCFAENPTYERRYSWLEALWAGCSPWKQDWDKSLLEAIKHNRPEDVEHFLKCGAHPDTTDKIGKTLLHYAAQKGY